MTPPNFVVDGQFAFIGRQIRQREMMFNNAQARLFVLFTLFWKARVHGLTIHAVVIAPDRYGLIVFDPHGQRSEFMRDAHSLITKYANDCLRIKDSAWRSGKPDGTLHATSEDVLDNLAKLITLPCALAIVDRADDFKWQTFDPRDTSKMQRIERPAWFDAKGEAPEFVIAKAESFPFLSTRTATEVRQMIESRVLRCESRCRAERRGLQVLGMRALGSKLATISTSLEELFAHRHHKRGGATRSLKLPEAVGMEGPKNAPRFACPKGLEPKVLAALEAFYKAYRKALMIFKDTKSGVFPPGTLRMKQVFRVDCDPLPTSHVLFPIYSAI